MLEQLGFEVVTAMDGQEAVRIFEQEEESIDFVLMDLTMPHMDGEEAYRELRRIDPKVRVIISSGYTEQEITSRFQGKSRAGFIQKPYALEALREGFRKVIG